MSPLNTIGRRLLGLLCLLPASAAGAQSPGTAPIARIAFKPGATTATVQGTVAPPRTVGPDMTSPGSQRYFLSARAGQTLTLQIHSPGGRAAFSLIKPSPAMAKYEIMEKAGGVKHWSGRLALSGDYLVLVFCQNGKAAAPFTLTVTLREGHTRGRVAPGKHSR